MSAPEFSRPEFSRIVRVDEVRGGDLVAVLHRGRIVATGSADEVTAGAGAPDLVAAFSKLTAEKAPAA